MGRVLRGLLVLAFLVLFAALTWVSVRGAQARGHLEDTAAGLQQLPVQVGRLQLDDATATVERVQQRTAQARDLTSDPVWETLARFPWGGQNLEAVTAATASADDLAGTGLPAVLAATQEVARLQELAVAGDPEAADPAAAQRVRQHREVLAEALARSRADLAGVDRDHLVRAVRTALDRLGDGLDDAADASQQLEVQLPAVAP